MPIINIVASGSFNQNIDLENLSHTSGLEIIYNPKKYHGGYLIIEKRKVTLYKSGKYILTGLKQIEDVDRVYTLISRTLFPFMDISRFSPPKIQNIVMVENLGKKVNLISLPQEHPELKIQYEPEQFPGLVCRRNEGTILLFSTGKMVLTGLKNIEDGEMLKEFISGII